jgi:hypothetical protein
MLGVYTVIYLVHEDCIMYRKNFSPTVVHATVKQNLPLALVGMFGQLDSWVAWGVQFIWAQGTQSDSIVCLVMNETLHWLNMVRSGHTNTHTDIVYHSCKQISVYYISTLVLCWFVSFQFPYKLGYHLQQNLKIFAIYSSCNGQETFLFSKMVMLGPLTTIESHV